jgi:4-hydroxy-3-polyprenylbenzoate decarboxylase
VLAFLDFAETARLDSKIPLPAEFSKEPLVGKIITVGVTGASGAVLARTTLRLLEADARVSRVHLVVTAAGQRLLAQELGISTADSKQLPALLSGTRAQKIEMLPNQDVGASIASGSYPVDAMIVIPCSAGTLASIANGASDDLLARAADVCLKERRTLLLCLRETPLNRVHLQNMLRAQEAGAGIMPVVPAFYYAPQTIDDLVEQFVCRALAQIGLPQEHQYRWEGQAKARAREA